MLSGVLTAAITVLVTAAYLSMLAKYMTRRTAVGVVRALRRNPSSPYVVRIHGWVPTIGAWNPAQPLRRSGQVFGSGVATYRLNADDQVQLTWQPDSGAAHHYTGAVPRRIDPGLRENRKRVLTIRTAIGVYVGALLIGFVVGYVIADGGVMHRGEFGIAGMFLAMVTVWLVVTIVSVAHGTHSTLRSQHRADPESRA